MDIELKLLRHPTLLSVSSSASSSGVLPEFHVGMFKDLASADGSIREAAVEALATELMEVQRGYEWLENKELAKDGGVKLESETDDGWNCARQGFELGRLAEEWISERNTPLIKEFTCLPIALASRRDTCKSLRYELF
ncbi:hypothetical protein M0R45_000403 [Rubus argutus]|uniref:Uncharacterized protein n=1 Tax=Rubus argutus TaxID=59490 RepID=A0AAW1VKU8_RUBAR